MARYAIHLSFLIFSGFTLNAAPPENKSQVVYHLNLLTGTILPHHESIIYFNRDYIRGLELNAWIRQGENSPYNSRLGIAYLVSGLGNREIYGHNHALFCNILGKPYGNFLPLQINFGFGVSWLTKKFDLESNYFNRAIGSHLNVYAQAGAKVKIPIDSRTILNSGLHIHHVSNGSVNAPNQGLNYLTLNVGIEFRSDHTFRSLYRDTKIGAEKGDHRFAFIYAPGIKESDRRVDKQFFTSSFIFDYGYFFHAARSVGLGLSIFYNDTWAYIPFIRTDKNRDFAPFQSAVHLSWQMNRGPLAFILHPGFYIYHPAPNAPFMTNRFGLKYSFVNNFCLQIAVKAHWFANADYFEWGIGYEFKK
jgi:hypothetical protein